MEDIEIRSEEVQEILGTPPRWIIRWGITIMLFVVAILLGGSFFYKYPDFISARITILSENPPVQIVAKSNGKLDQLFIKNNQLVQKNEVLAVIENTADYTDTKRLLAKLDSIALWFNVPEKFLALNFSESYSLGQYQSFLSTFVSQLKGYQTFLNFNPYAQRIESLQRQVNDYNIYYQRLKAQTRVLKQEYELTYHQFLRDSSLYSQKILSDVDYEKSKAAMLKQKFTWQNALTGMANTQITINNLTQQIQEQDVLKAESGSRELAALKERYDNLINQLIAWEQAFILKSPIEGIVTFTNFWSANQFVVPGEVVFTVVPRFEQNIVGRATVPIAGAGKIEPGQQVNIKLDNFPHMEFGIIEGRVVNISKVPVNTENGVIYTAEIILVNNLTTNYNRNLPFSQEMQGMAEIVTKDRRLIERLVEPLISIFRYNF
ncbi:MAG TPA: HlyD family efflux transporter periplasmic adaptor subunit [Mariniphaga sp.]|nr:HlyD family efflux transporter periplasmic adaptor subunit [Mariniphaga sp.]